MGNFAPIDQSLPTNRPTSLPLATTDQVISGFNLALKLRSAAHLANPGEVSGSGLTRQVKALPIKQEKQKSLW